MEKFLDQLAYLLTGLALGATTIIIPLALDASQVATCGMNYVGWLAILYRTRPRHSAPAPTSCCGGRDTFQIPPGLLG